VQKLAAYRRIQVNQQLTNAVELARRQYTGNTRRIDAIQDEAVNGSLAKVLSDFRAGVVRTKCLLVDVFLKDVAENVGIDFVVLAAGRIVQIPRVPLKKGVQVLEGFIRDSDLRPPLFDGMGQKQATVEVLDFPQQFVGLRVAFIFRLGKAFEEQGFQELLIVRVAALLAGLRELVLKVLPIPVIEKEFALQEVDEHQAVEQDRGIPLLVALVVNAFDEFQKSKVLLLKLDIELFGNALYIQGFFQAVGDFQQGNVARFVKLADVEDH